MVKLSNLSIAWLIPAVLATPTDITIVKSGDVIEARQGYYFQDWSENGSNIRCVNGDGGSYTADWDSGGGFVCGKGWSGAGARWDFKPSLPGVFNG